MKTVTITFQNDQDAESLMTQLQTMKFQDQAEVYEMNEDISDEDLDAFDEKMEEFYEKPFDDQTYAKLQKELKEKFDIRFHFYMPE